MNHEVIFSRLNRRNRPMERRKFKSHLPAAAYLIIFLIYIIYLFVGAGKFIFKKLHNYDPLDNTKNKKKRLFVRFLTKI